MHDYNLDDDPDDDGDDDDDDFDDDDDGGDEDEDDDEDVETWQVFAGFRNNLPLKPTLCLTSGADVLDWPGFPAELTSGITRPAPRRDDRPFWQTPVTG
jgi:hypothetical protein